MKTEPSKPGSSTPFWAILGICAGAGSLLYLLRRHGKSSVSNDLIRSAKSADGTEPEPGDIILFHNARGLNKIITSFTGSQFYHVALYAGDGRTVEARTPGVVRQDLRSRKGDFVVAAAPKGKGRAALAWAESQVGDAYDNLDIAVIVLDRLCRSLHFNYTPKDKYSCGEFIAVAFDKAGAHLFPEQELGEVVPGDFARFLPISVRRRAK